MAILVSEAIHFRAKKKKKNHFHDKRGSVHQGTALALNNRNSKDMKQELSDLQEEIETFTVMDI